jgi:hypothetical protein
MTNKYKWNKKWNQKKKNYEKKIVTPNNNN